MVTRVDKATALKDDFNVLKCLQLLEVHDSPVECELRYDVYQRLLSMISINGVCRPLEIYAMLLETDNQYFFRKCCTKMQMHRKMRLYSVHYVAQLMHYEILGGQLDHGALLESLPVWRGDENRWNQFVEIVHQQSTNRLREHLFQAVEIPDEAVPSIQEGEPVEAMAQAQVRPTSSKSERQVAIEARYEKWRTQQAQKKANYFSQKQQDQRPELIEVTEQLSPEVQLKIKQGEKKKTIAMSKQKVNAKQQLSR